MLHVHLHFQILASLCSCAYVAVQVSLSLARSQACRKDQRGENIPYRKFVQPRSM